MLRKFLYYAIFNFQASYHVATSEYKESGWTYWCLVQISEIFSVKDIPVPFVIRES